MMDLLKRFEEDNLNDPFAAANADADADGDGEDDLARRVAGMELGASVCSLVSLFLRVIVICRLAVVPDAATYDQLWAALMPAERDRFMKAVQDPSSELAQQLLASQELAEVAVEPWWEASAAPVPPTVADAPLKLPAAPPKKYGHPPMIMPIPPSTVQHSGPSVFPLAYNVVCVLLVSGLFPL